MLLQIQNLPPICWCFSFLEGDSGLFVLPVRVWRLFKMKPVTKHPELHCPRKRLCQHRWAPFICINTFALEWICKTALTPLVKNKKKPSSVSSFKSHKISELPFFYRRRCREPHFSISGVRKGQGVKSLFQYYIFSTLLPVFWENGGSFAAWLSVYIFFTRLYWNYNCVLLRLLLVPCSV